MQLAHLVTLGALGAAASTSASAIQRRQSPTSPSINPPQVPACTGSNENCSVIYGYQICVPSCTYITNYPGQNDNPFDPVNSGQATQGGAPALLCDWHTLKCQNGLQLKGCLTDAASAGITQTSIVGNCRTGDTPGQFNYDQGNFGAAVPSNANSSTPTFPAGSGSSSASATGSASATNSASSSAASATSAAANTASSMAAGAGSSASSAINSLTSVAAGAASSARPNGAAENMRPTGLVSALFAIGAVLGVFA